MLKNKTVSFLNKIDSEYHSILATGSIICEVKDDPQIVFQYNADAVRLLVVNILMPYDMKRGLPGTANVQTVLGIMYTVRYSPHTRNING